MCCMNFLQTPSQIRMSRWFRIFHSISSLFFCYWRQWTFPIRYAIVWCTIMHLDINFITQFGNEVAWLVQEFIFSRYSGVLLWEIVFVPMTLINQIKINPGNPFQGWKSGKNFFSFSTYFSIQYDTILGHTCVGIYGLRQVVYSVYIRFLEKNRIYGIYGFTILWW